MTQQPQNVEGDLPDPDSPDWLPDLQERVRTLEAAAAPSG